MLTTLTASPTYFSTYLTVFLPGPLRMCSFFLLIILAFNLDSKIMARHAGISYFYIPYYNLCSIKQI